jgi:thiamine pyrophosphate-dependent acetolactate synthase large subunit-like protein
MLTREEFIGPLMRARGDAIVVTTMGIVRPWGRQSRHELDFASADSAMGHAADLALGIALAQPERKVLCLNGDGSMLMTLGTLVTAVEANPRNYFLFVLQNGTYEITGNQPIPGAGKIDFSKLAEGAGFERVYSFKDAGVYARSLPQVLAGDGPVFVTVRIEPGSEGPISRSDAEESLYLRPSIAESAHRLRRALLRPT